MRIGWIGLGGIGTQMVLRALGAGHEVTAYARGKGLAEVEAAGAIASADYAAVARDKDVVAFCLFSDAQMRDVLFDGGALAAMSPGTVIAIHTTGSPDLARELQQRAPVGVHVIDATFSGGPADTAAGALTLMIGGETEAIDRARPLLETYGNRIHHVGALGEGQVVKLLNNLLFAANLQNAAEILRMAEQQGIDTAAAACVFQDCSGGSYASALFKAAPIEAMLEVSRPYLAKDVKVALAGAMAAGMDVSPFRSTAAYFGADG